MPGGKQREFLRYVGLVGLVTFLVGEELDAPPVHTAESPVPCPEPEAGPHGSTRP